MEKKPKNQNKNVPKNTDYDLARSGEGALPFKLEVDELDGWQVCRLTRGSGAGVDVGGGARAGRPRPLPQRHTEKQAVVTVHAILRISVQIVHKLDASNKS